MISRDDLPDTPDWQPEPHAWDETEYLLASPANAARLRAALARLDRLHIPAELPERFELGEN